MIKRRLAELSAASPEINAFLQENVAIFNGTRGDPRSFDLLDQLLQDQPYRLAYWRVAADEINYRRFFDVNELAAICMERPDVFQKTHGLILRLVAEGKATGCGSTIPTACMIRPNTSGGSSGPDFFSSAGRPSTPKIDPDHRLSHQTVRGTRTRPRRRARWEDVEVELGRRFDALAQAEKKEPLAQPLYLVVEKILEPGERLPENWPVYGTTGYDFLNVLNGIFVDRRHAKTFDALYARFIRQPLEYKELVYRCKKLIMQASMAAEINVLGHHLDRISELNRRSRDFTLNSLTEALREVIACFPVYRTYVTAAGVLDRDRRYIELAVARAKRRNPATSASIFDLVRDILLLSDAYCPDEAARAEQQHFVGRFQQVTGPVMAKSVEDTAFYRYNRLVSLNEVGGDPERFGTTLAAFHQHNLERQAHWPRSLLATSTHDTKRGEDVRARIDVLSEIPNEFRSQVFKWARMNRGRKTVVEDEPAPSRNDEFLLYQTLLGSWPLEPLDAAGRATYIERIQQYMLKATHEAKAKTSWVSPNEAYERATRDFVAALLEPSPPNLFLADFEPFARRVAELGIWNSLSQTVLKLTCPGVPDLYQGTELWDFSLVDPDNRRPVDYARRRAFLQSLRQRAEAQEGTLGKLARELVDKRIDGAHQAVRHLEDAEPPSRPCRAFLRPDGTFPSTRGARRRSILRLCPKDAAGDGPRRRSAARCRLDRRVQPSADRRGGLVGHRNRAAAAGTRREIPQYFHGRDHRGLALLRGPWEPYCSAALGDPGQLSGRRPRNASTQVRREIRRLVTSPGRGPSSLAAISPTALKWHASCVASQTVGTWAFKARKAYGGCCREAAHFGGVRESLGRLFQERLGPAEMRRRAHHILPGFLPLLLWVIPHPHPWIVTSVVAALIVGAAFVTFVRFHCIKRGSEGRNDCIVAVVGYAGSILVTLLLFAPHVEVAFLVLGVLAFGDGSATLGGMLFGGRRLPWNPQKTIVGTACFLFIGTPMAAVLYLGEARSPLGRSPLVAGWLLFRIRPLLRSRLPSQWWRRAQAAIAESLPSRTNDNLRVGALRPLLPV